MLKNYLIVAFRNFSLNKLFSFINVFGLAIGIASCLIIYLWVQKELSYDQFHKNADRIYRIERELFRDKLFSRWPITGGKYKQALIDEVPEIENAVRFWGREISVKDYRQIIHRQRLFATDNSIFEIFDFELTKGDAASALTDPKTVVLTHDKAIKYFGTDNVLGKSLVFEWRGEPTDFKVTGILKDVPENSHIQFDMLTSIASYPEKEYFPEWRSNYLYTYVLINKFTSRTGVENKLKIFIENHLEPVYGDLLVGDAGIHDVLKMHLFPITDIHLYPSVNWELEVGGSIISVYIFSSISVLILFIACLNFINLSTARANKRAKEVSLRKTVGANKNQLQSQFILESILLTFLAFLIALALIKFLLPLFNILFNESLSINYLLEINRIFLFIAIAFTVGFLAGLYPSFYLTQFKPAHAIKRSFFKGTGKSGFRRNLVVVQFVISITMIIGMFTIYSQIEYIQNKPLGYDKENVVIIPIRSDNVRKNYNSFRNDLVSNSQIISVTASADIPSDRIYGNTNYGDASQSESFYSMENIYTGFDFVETYKMKLIAGRSFSRSHRIDTSGTIMLNKSAVNKLGWKPEEAIGKELSHRRGMISKVVGVVENFNFKSLHNKIEPLVILLSEDYISYISVRINFQNFEQTLKYINQSWEKIFSNESFECGFLDNRLVELYNREQKTNNIFLLFSSLSILIACLGLLGLSTFMTEDRTKEIGIRKVLGASEINIVKILSIDFLKWVLLANIIAWPVAWLAMNRWLQNFAYKINLEIWMFFLASCLALIIALGTVSVQAIRAAITNPVKSLRYE